MRNRLSSRRAKTACALAASACVVLGAGCSDSNSEPSVQPTTADTVPETAPTTSQSPATTVAPSTTEAPATTTTVPGPLVYPLTGLLATDLAAFAHPALVVKIDNAPGARPQTGFNAADIVVEEIINAHITRFAMVFQSQGGESVGPIRSGRIQDINLFGSFNHPLFAWSGGNKTVTAAVDASDLVNLSQLRAKGYFRTEDRVTPHNLYAYTSVLWKQAPPGSLPPVQQFTYRAAGIAPAGVPSAGVNIALDSIDVEWAWDAAAGLYRRRMEHKVHDDAAAGQVTTNNVVVLVMEYLPGISDSPDAQTIGTGEAFIFSAGNYVHAKWSRDDRLKPFTLTADDGSVVKLTPGRTFIELPRTQGTQPLPAP